jgi:glycosyltransferase involved in cell wall biosynthesis
MPVSTDATPSRIAFVLGQNDRGGTELQARLLIRSLRLYGVEVEVFLVDGRQGAEGLGDSVTVLSTGRPGTPSHALLHYLGMCRRLRRALDRHSVVHSAMARAYVLTALATWGRPKLRHVSWRRNQGVHLDSGGWVSRALERFAGRGTDLFVANSHAVVDYWAAVIPGFRERAVVVHNLLDFDRFPETPASAEDSQNRKLKAVCVGALKPGKGHDNVLEALATAGLNDRVSVEFVGEGPMRRELQASIDAYDVDVTLVGEVDDVVEHLESADFFIHASLSEGLSNAVAEAMAVGLPVIVTRTGGVPELVGDSGVLVAPGDVTGLACAIADLVRDAERRASLGRSAYARARTFFDNDRVLDQYLAAYRGNN